MDTQHSPNTVTGDNEAELSMEVRSSYNVCLQLISLPPPTPQSDVGSGVLGGAVAVSCVVNLMLLPYGALLLGSAVGAVCVLARRYLTVSRGREQAA